MEIHKPKPVHNWREFLSEVLIILLGVSIALAAEQTIEAIHWHHKIDQSEDALRMELVEDNAPQAYLRMAVAACYDGQLDRIATALRSGADRTAIAPLATTYAPPVVSWDSEVWRATLASDVGSHMPAKQMLLWSSPYRIVPLLASANDQEANRLTDLQLGDDTPGAVTPAQRERMMLAIDALRRDNLLMFRRSRTLLHGLLDLKMEISDPDRAKILSDLRGRFGACVNEPAYRHYDPYDVRNGVTPFTLKGVTGATPLSR
jgi:hypothetical protein